MSFAVDFQPVGRRGACPAGRSLLDHARDLGVGLNSLCSGQGTCARCKVLVLEGHLSPLTSAERQALTSPELKLGMRLACQAYPQSNVRVSVPPDSLLGAQRTQVEGQEILVPVEPIVSCVQVAMEPPSLDDLTADADRLHSALSEPSGHQLFALDTEMLRTLSPLLRAQRWQVSAFLRGAECIAVRPVGSRPIGLAFDLGTTKVAGYLVDLDSGRTMASKAVMNPQIPYGEDVVSRIARALQSAAEASRMQQLAEEALASLAEDLTDQVGASLSDVMEAVVVGNTAMHHLLVRLPVEQLAMAPYVPAVAQALDIKARDLGLSLAPGAYVHLLPNIAGYVGADHVAMILGTELWKTCGSVLALDIGTNTEICLAHRGQLTSVSCASGPAFEGAHISNGMRAANGAIEHLRLVGDGIEYETVGNSPPAGLCGSGVLDALAAVRAAGAVDESGRMGEHPRVRSRDGQLEFVLLDWQAAGPAKAITLTQHDVRELQLAKGAIRTGIQVLLQQQQLSDGDLDGVLVAGAFGSYIDVSSAIAIGLLPALPLKRVRQVGNAAGTGARLALVSRAQRQQAAEVARRVRYVELAGLPEFAEVFALSTNLGEYHVTCR